MRFSRWAWAVCAAAIFNVSCGSFSGAKRDHDSGTERQALCNNNGVCDPGEDASTCAADCFLIAVCGDNVCDASENAFSCPGDCGGSWFPIGPAPLDSTVTNLGGSHLVPNLSAAGRATVIAVNPKNAADAWLGTAGGGVWHSSDLGFFDVDAKGVRVASDPAWRPMTDDMPSTAIGAVALTNCSVTRCDDVWIGTGENSIRRQTYYGAGLIHGHYTVVSPPTIAAGRKNAPAAPSGSYVFTPFATESFRFGSVNDLIVHPTSGLVYAIVGSGLTSSMAGGPTLAPEPLAHYGFHRCDPAGTDDVTTPEDERCTNLLQMSSTNGEAGLPSDMELVNDRFYIGVYDTGLLRSEPGSDTAFCYVNPGPAQPPSCPADPRPPTNALPDPSVKPFDHIEIAAGAGGTLFAIFGRCTADPAHPNPIDDPFFRTLGNCSSDMFRSTDGLNWTALPRKSVDEYSRFTHLLSVHSEDDNILYNGGTSSLVELNISANASGEKASDTLHGDMRELAVIGTTRRTQEATARRTACQADPVCAPCLSASPPATCSRADICSASPTPAGCPDLSKDLLYAVTDGGIYFIESTKGQTGLSSVIGGWASANHNLVTSQLFGLGAAVIPPPPATMTTPPPGTAPFQGTIVLGGIQDNGSALFSGGAQWQLFDQADGGEQFVGTNGDLIAITQSGAMMSQNASPSLTPSSFSTVAGGSQQDTPNASFYPSYVRVPPVAGSGGIFYVTDAVFTDPGFAFGTTQISPVFADLATSPILPYLERKDAIPTAIGVGGSSPRIWVGLHDGQIWLSDAGSGGSLPCNTASCWHAVQGSSMPHSAVTHIDVDPANPSVARVSFSGFTTGDVHVWTTANAGGSWDPVPGLPDREPVNVVKLDPRDGTTLWAGTDHGLWVKQGSDNWIRFLPASGLPNAPVFDVEFDVTNNRVFAATHGRGVFMRTAKPQLTSFEGWVHGSIWDIPIYGTGFVCNQASCSCQLEVLLEDGTTCAGPSKFDADNPPGTIELAPDKSGHFLTTKNGSEWEGKPVVWACRSGFCVGNGSGNRVPISNCEQDPNNRIAAVKVACENNDAVLVPVAGDAPELARPPSSVLTASPPATSPKRVARSVKKGAQVAAAVDSGPSFTVVPSVLSSTANGGERALCGVQVSAAPGQSVDELQDAIAQAINDDPGCAAAGLTAEVEDGVGGHPEEEDAFPGVPHVVLKGSDALVGTELVLGVRANPGSVVGMCFDLDRLSDPVRRQLGIQQLVFTTAASGAAGGTLEIGEHSPIGACNQTIPTAAGQTPQQIAAAVEAAFLANTGIPGAPGCRSSQNPRDIERSGRDDAVVTVLPEHVKVCVNDAGIGFQIGPEGVPLAPPVALCRDVPVSADASCHGTVTSADVDAGSFDPDGPPPSCTLDSAGPFSPGAHTVTFTCVDSTGLAAQCQSTITVSDTTPPTLSCPVSVNATCTGASGATVSFSTSATDNCGASAVTCTQSSGTTFPLGTRADGCTVHDAAGNSASCGFNVTVALGDNPICCPAGTNIIQGTSTNNTLNGTSGRDCILGKGGQDTINGNGGDDIISGGDGDDIISGGLGNDLIFGGAGQDRLTGDGGNDVISGGDGDDQCSGGDGNDTLLGGQGQDRLFGDAGADILIGETGDDHIEGGDGNDSLDGSGVHDVCIGGAGTDTFLVCESQTQ
jgi:hypothetical protein